MLVGVVGKDREGAKRDAVAGLHDLKVVVVNGIGQHRCHQRAAAGGRAHPKDVVIAPLDIHAVMLQQRVHDDIRTGASVENIAHQVQLIHSRPLDEVADGGDKVRRLADLDDGGDDVFEVVPLVGFLTMCIEQLFHDIRVVLRQRLAHLGARIALGGQPRQRDQTVEGEVVPRVQVVDLRLEQFQLFLRIVHQRRELSSLLLRERVGKEQVDPLAHHAGAGIEDMEKGLVLAVDVGDEVLAALRQIHNGPQIDDLRPGRANRRVHAGEHAQKAQLLGRIASMQFHFAVLLKSRDLSKA